MAVSKNSIIGDEEAHGLGDVDMIVGAGKSFVDWRMANLVLEVIDAAL